MPTFFQLTNKPLELPFLVGTIPGHDGYTIQVNDKRFETTKKFKTQIEATPGFKNLTAEEKSVLVLDAYLSLNR